MSKLKKILNILLFILTFLMIMFFAVKRDQQDDQILEAVNLLENTNSEEPVHSSTELSDLQLINLVEEPPLGVATMETISVVLEDIYFKFNQAVVDASYMQVIERNASVINQFGIMKCVVVGYADSSGDEYYNFQLSYLRGKSVREQLAKLCDCEFVIVCCGEVNAEQTFINKLDRKVKLIPLCN